jgi:hypothetical protein
MSALGQCLFLSLPLLFDHSGNAFEIVGDPPHNAIPSS